MSENEIPSPPDPDSSGDQRAEDIGDQLVQHRPASEFTVADTITGLASTKTRQLGGEVGSALIAGATTQMAHNLHETKKELSELRDRYECCRNCLAAVRIEKAVLETRESQNRNHRHLKNFGIFAGTTLLGLGFEIAATPQSNYGYVVAGLGGLLLLASWLNIGRAVK